MNQLMFQSSQLLVFARCTGDGDFKKDFLFCNTVDITTGAHDVLEVVNNFLKTNGMSWEKLVGSTTDGAPAMLGTR